MVSVLTFGILTNSQLSVLYVRNIDESTLSRSSEFMACIQMRTKGKDVPTRNELMIDVSPLLLLFAFFVISFFAFFVWQ